MAPRRVMLWSPPRTLSTAVERVLIEHPSIQVYHEPFGTPYYWSSEAGSGREAEDKRTSPTYSEVAELLWRTPLGMGKSFLFSKNLAYYFAPHCLPRMSQMLGDACTDVVHSFIIRHPAKAIASLYYKSCVDNEATGYTYFDPAEAGFTAMRDLLEHVEQQPGVPPCVILDADDLLEDPEGLMRAYCEVVALPFTPSMLSWTPGPVKELESPWSGWTDDVVNSSGLMRRAKSSKLPPVDELPAEVRKAIAEAMPVYEAMHKRRIRPASPPPPAKPPAKPIGASFSLDEVLFAFKTAHPAPSARVGPEQIVSLSRPIRAVLSADILLSASREVCVE